MYHLKIFAYYRWRCTPKRVILIVTFGFETPLIILCAIKIKAIGFKDLYVTDLVNVPFVSIPKILNE